MDLTRISFVNREESKFLYPVRGGKKAVEKTNALLKCAISIQLS